MKTAILVLSLAACGGGGASHADGPVGSDGSASCGSNTDCTGASASVCDTSETPHACVECTTGDHAACTGTTPVCTSDSCGACTKDNDCVDSGVCMPDGSCAAATDVLYADPAGSGTACTMAAPCALTEAINDVAGSQTIIHLNEGTYDINGTLMIGKTATLVGRGATIDRNKLAGSAVQVSGAVTATFDFVEVTGGDGPAAGYGIDCETATVTIESALIDANAGIGVYANGCALTISRSIVASNMEGGISATGAGTTFDVSNSFIHHNGNTGDSIIGGASLPAAASATSRFEFNTVVDNSTATNSLTSGGVIGNKSGFAIPNNIIAHNSNGDTTTSNANTIGSSDFSGSAVSHTETEFNFNSATNPYDYHLTAGSSAIDASTVTSTVVTDFDGDMRPIGAADDLGADEYKP